jgi:choline dehydrogenase
MHRSVYIPLLTRGCPGILGLLLMTVAGLEQILLRDINAPGASSREGLYQVPLAISNATRNGAREFILTTVNAVKADGSRKYQLDVLLNTLVTKVRFNGKTAIGVDFLSGQSLYRADSRSNTALPTGMGSVNVTREVVLSAGAFNTPQLLKLSGIGPAAELQQFNIPVIVDLPGVGTNLQDRYESTVIGKTATDFEATTRCTFGRTLLDPCYQDWANGVDPISKGVYGTNGLAIAIVKKSSVASGEPDILISGAPAVFTGYYPGYSNIAFADARHWVWVVLKAHSRNNAGTVKLRSSDPRDTPVINFHSFDEGITADGAADLDLQAVYEGMQFSRQAFSDLIPLGGTFSEIWPGTNVTTEDQMKAFIMKEAWGHHASCTCPIGADSDPMAVLDSRFRVRGVKSLRVVDASVFPKIPGFYISLPIYIISEKAADVIIQDAA